MVPLFAHLNSDQAQTYSLVLASAGIAHAMHRQGSRWGITVAQHERGAAQQAISLYLSENPISPEHPAAFSPRHPHSWSGLYAALLLAAVHIAIAGTGQQALFITTFGADARLILVGQAYRCITALLLHSDWAHLLGNMAATALFGTFTARIYGWGFSWLLIVATGALGNACTAWWYGDHHLSVGASTGIFAALGLCAASTFRGYKHFRSRRRHPWLPLAGALALLGWLGTSPRSDLLAHLFGLVCGCCIGVACATYLSKYLNGSIRLPLQTVSFVLMSSLLVGSCWWGGFIEL